MGRRPNVPQATKDGTYRCWHPSLKKYIGLGTRDYAQACAIQAGFYPGRQATQDVSSGPTETSVSGNGMEDNPVGVIDFDKMGTKPDASSLLNKWANGGSGTIIPPAANPVSPPIQPSTEPAGPTGLSALFSPSNPAVTKPNTKKNQLTPEQSAKLASGLKKIVTNLNVVVVGAGVQMFGRVPAPLDDEEIELLQMGWEMFIDDMFAKAKIKPWHVLLAGNIMIAASMYVGGTPVPKKQLPADASKAKSGTVTPIDGGKQ